MGKKKKKNKHKPKYRWNPTRPEEINAVAIGLFGKRYLCMGDKIDQKED